MTISIVLNDEDAKLFQKYAELNGITMSELVRRSVLERIEDEYDLELYKQAIKEYENNPITYTLDEVCGELLKK